MRRLQVYLILTILSFQLSCDTTIQADGSSGRILPNVTGGAGEVLVVMDKFAWDGAAGNSLKEILEAEYPGLPQVEPLFSITHITSASFDNLFRYHRSVVMATINRSQEEPAIRFRKNVWAKPQIVVQMQASSSEEIRQLIDENNSRIQSFLVQYDRQRVSDSYAESRDPEIAGKFAESHHIRLSIPRGYNVDFFKQNYGSVTIETPDFIQVVHVYEFPADGPEDLSTENLLNMRNKFSEEYVRGPREGSYMTTADIYPPLVYDIQKDGLQKVEIRGLWELENGFMGGPFISHSIYDANRSRIVTAEGYLYYPNQKKRVKMRQLEAIIYSMELI